MTKFLHYEVFKVQCGFKAAVPLISGTFNILAHALLSVKHFFNFFSKFFSARGLVYAQCFAAGYFRQLDYITTLYPLCQAPFLIFFDNFFPTLYIINLCFAYFASTLFRLYTVASLSSIAGAYDSLSSQFFTFSSHFL